MARRTERAAEAGFALTELMVVVLVIGILMAVALPMYLSSRERGQDRATQADLRSALVGALTYYAETRTYSGFGPAQGDAEIPNLAWVAPGPPARGQLAIAVASSANLVLVSRSASGTYFCVAQIANSPATDQGRGIAFADVNTTAGCTGGW